MPVVPNVRPSSASAESRPRGPGRPSKAPARQAAILEAFISCIREFGLERATIERVAGALGVSRTLVFHYFGDTQTLLRAAVGHIITNSVRRLSLSLAGASPAAAEAALLDFAFDGPHFQELQDVAVMAEVTALANRDAEIAAMLSEAWEGWIEAVVNELSACFPQADPAQCESVGYAVLCLAEQHWALTFVGPGSTRGPAARAAAEMLLATLRLASTGSSDQGPRGGLPRT